MTIDTKRLRYFVQVAESGSLSKASEELYIAQPALSRQIHMLEDSLGFPLFTRTGRGMTLTQEGRYLRDAVSGPLRNIELAIENMRAFMSRAPDFSLGIGIHNGVSQILTAPLVEALDGVLPNMRFRIMEGTSSGLYEGLKHGALDFVVLDRVFQNDNLSFQLLFSENLVLLGTTKTAVFKSSITLKDLTDFPLVLPCSHQSVRKVIDNRVRQEKLTLNVVLETDSINLMLDLVRRQKGLALLNRSMAHALCGEYSDLVIIDMEPNLMIDTYLAGRVLEEVSGSNISLAEKSIIQSVKQCLQGHTKD